MLLTLSLNMFGYFQKSYTPKDASLKPSQAEMSPLQVLVLLRYLANNYNTEGVLRYIMKPCFDFSKQVMSHRFKNI